MSEEVYFIDEKTWDDWVIANPNLVNLDVEHFMSTVDKHFHTWTVGWIEIGAFDE